MKALVLAELNKHKLETEFPNISFDYAGYAINFNVLPHNELKRIITTYDILISEFDMVDKEVLDAAKNLKILICCRGGIGSQVRNCV